MISDHKNITAKAIQASGQMRISFFKHDGEKIGIITGATSGIGKAFAILLAQQGFNLVITGRRHQLLNEVADELTDRFRIKVFTVMADLSVKKDVQYLLHVIEKLPRIDILVNNAGYGLKTKFHQDEIENQLKMLQVHVTTPILLIHKVLSPMINARQGVIINVSSLASYTPTADNSMYAGTKSFLRNFTISQHLALRQYGIKVQCLCPGFTHTDFHKKIGIAPNFKNIMAGWLEPGEVVKYSISHLHSYRVMCIPGRWNRMVLKLLSVIPASLQYVLSDLIKSHLFRHKDGLMPD
jgi:short-subunit dehydrogenase